MHEPSGDLERVATALSESFDLPRVSMDLSVLARLQTVLRKGDWSLTLAVHQDGTDASAKVLDIWPGYYEGGIYGLAVDLGSTTIAAHLCELKTGDVKASAGIATNSAAKPSPPSPGTEKKPAA